MFGFKNNAFGMVMPERSFSSEKYRWGFNGKETDNETKWQDYGFRIYYPGLGKFLSVDPLQRVFPYFSPYHFSGNSPIVSVDIDGREPQDYRERWNVVGEGSTSRGQIVETILDKTTNQYWSIMHYPNSDKMYYLSQYSDGQPIQNSPRVWGASDNKGASGEWQVYWQGFTPLSEVEAVQKGVDDFARALVYTLAAPAIVAASAELGLLALETKLSSGVGSAAADFTSQFFWSGGNIDAVNWSSVAASGVFSSPITSSFVGCATELNVTELGISGGITDKSLPTVGFETIMGAAGNKVGDKWLDGLAGVGGSGFWSETGISFMANSMGDQPSQGATVVGEWLHNEKTSNKNGTPSESE